MKSPSPTALTVPEAAAYLGLTTAAIRAYVKSNRLTSIRIDGRTYQIELSSLEQYKATRDQRKRNAEARRVKKGNTGPVGPMKGTQ